MFKKKKIVKTTEDDEIFVIPQIVSPYEGLKRSKDKFKPSTFASPIFGTGLSDKPSYDDNSDEMGDYDVKYDSFRSDNNKKIDDEYNLKKFGTKYPGFEEIDEDSIKEIYGEDLKIQKKNLTVIKDEPKAPTFSFIEDTKKENFKADEIKDEVTDLKIDVKEENNDNDSVFNFDDFEPEVHEEAKLETPVRPIFSRNGQYSNQSTVIVRKQKTENNYNELENKNYTNIKNESTFENVANNVYTETKKFEPLNHVNEENVNLNVDNHIKENEDFKKEVTINEFNEIKTEETISEDSFVKYEEPQELILPVVLNPYQDYKLPPLSLISRSEDLNESDLSSLEESKEIINQTLASFDINGMVEHYVEGPTFTRYEISLEIGTNVKKILSIQDTLQMNLGVTSLRIQAPIPGKKTVGIEVPNRVRKSVAFGDILSEDYINDGKVLNVALGKDIDGNVITTNIAKWPHGLIAGSTGSGKSVSINTIIVSILLKAKPDEVKFLMIDPKVVELSVYNDIPHLITPVISDPKMSSKALDWAVNEMERRYNLFTTVKAREIVAYNEKAKEDPTMQRIPYIVIVIDEMADLMLQCGQEAEDSIKRLTAKARAAGIHLLCATQRPTVDVIKGTIKANIQTRIAFRVNSSVDSITILDESGAESLLGRGDMLIKEVDMARRVQGAYIKDEEIDAVVNFIHDEADAHYLFNHDDLNDISEQNGVGPAANIEEESTSMLYNVSVWCCENQMCSVNVIQKAFNLGFNRAQNIINKLQALGVVSERKGTRRDILMNLSQINDLFERTE